MSTRVRIAAAVLAAAFIGATPAAAAPPSQPGQQGYPHRPVCGPPAAGHARCHAEVITQQDGATPLVTAGPAGYGPADLRSAYNLTSATTAGSGQTIAIVDAYDLPSAESDLNTYRSQFGMTACTTANGCFHKVGQGSTLPAANASWGQEIALDLDMASAICPNCTIVLAEANSASVADLAATVDKAVGAGATVISNSYGANEFSGETSYDAHYNHPGIAITVSSGDNGYGVQYPASSPFVTAVGGTSLKRSTTSGRGWTETAWSGAGSGCSALEPQSSWQAGFGSCTKRTVADVSAVADPNTGVAVYDSTPYGGSSGWLVFGGTSVASPVVAGVYALAGNASTAGPSYPYSHRSALNDVTSGSNGRCKRTAYLCTAGPGYDGPTGLGTPSGTGAF